MRINLKLRASVLIGMTVLFTFFICGNTLAAPQWRDMFDEGKLSEGLSVAIKSGITVEEIAQAAVAERYPACDILVAMLKEKIEAYLALNALIGAGGNLEHLAICCSETGVNISSAVFAKVALDSGVEEKVVDHLLRIAFTPPPGETGVFKKESVVAGGEIREGPFASPYTFDNPFPPRIR